MALALWSLWSEDPDFGALNGKLQANHMDGVR
jgi:hypothetical protein